LRSAQRKRLSPAVDRKLTRRRYTIIYIYTIPAPRSFQRRAAAAGQYAP
jgi:hypothetical protein